MSGRLIVSHQRASSLRLLTLCLYQLTLFAQDALAEQKISHNNLEVHYVAFNSMFLEPAIAQKYALTRGPDIAILNISVRALDSEGQSRPATAELRGGFVNLLSQNQNLAFRETRERHAIYYVADFRFTEHEPLRFDLTVLTEGEVIPLQFQQRFYRE